MPKYKPSFKNPILTSLKRKPIVFILICFILLISSFVYVTYLAKYFNFKIQTDKTATYFPSESFITLDSPQTPESYLQVDDFIETIEGDSRIKKIYTEGEATGILSNLQNYNLFNPSFVFDDYIFAGANAFFYAQLEEVNIIDTKYAVLELLPSKILEGHPEIIRISEPIQVNIEANIDNEQDPFNIASIDKISPEDIQALSSLEVGKEYLFHTRIDISGKALTVNYIQQAKENLYIRPLFYNGPLVLENINKLDEFDLIQFNKELYQTHLENRMIQIHSAIPSGEKRIFSNNNSYSILSGRNFTAADIEENASVCIIDTKFAQARNIKIGDTLRFKYTKSNNIYEPENRFYYTIDKRPISLEQSEEVEFEVIGIFGPQGTAYFFGDTRKVFVLEQSIPNTFNYSYLRAGDYYRRENQGYNLVRSENTEKNSKENSIDFSDFNKIVDIQNLYRLDRTRIVFNNSRQQENFAEAYNSKIKDYGFVLHNIAPEAEEFWAVTMSTEHDLMGQVIAITTFFIFISFLSNILFFLSQHKNITILDLLGVDPENILRLIIQPYRFVFLIIFIGIFSGIVIHPGFSNFLINNITSSIVIKFLLASIALYIFFIISLIISIVVMFSYLTRYRKKQKKSTRSFTIQLNKNKNCTQVTEKRGNFGFIEKNFQNRRKHEGSKSVFLVHIKYALRFVLRNRAYMQGIFIVVQIFLFVCLLIQYNIFSAEKRIDYYYQTSELTGRLQANDLNTDIANPFSRFTVDAILNNSKVEDIQGVMKFTGVTIPDSSLLEEEIHIIIHHGLDFDENHFIGGFYQSNPKVDFPQVLLSNKLLKALHLDINSQISFTSIDTPYFTGKNYHIMGSFEQIQFEDGLYDYSNQNVILLPFSETQIMPKLNQFYQTAEFTFDKRYNREFRKNQKALEENVESMTWNKLQTTLEIDDEIFDKVIDPLERSVYQLHSAEQILHIVFPLLFATLSYLLGHKTSKNKMLVYQLGYSLKATNFICFITLSIIYGVISFLTTSIGILIKQFTVELSLERILDIGLLSLMSLIFGSFFEFLVYRLSLSNYIYKEYE